jgi:hypothetical protein
MISLALGERGKKREAKVREVKGERRGERRKKGSKSEAVVDLEHEFVGIRSVISF